MLTIAESDAVAGLQMLLNGVDAPRTDGCDRCRWEAARLRVEIADLALCQVPGQDWQRLTKQAGEVPAATADDRYLAGRDKWSQDVADNCRLHAA
jgi:hypothetical protein